MIGAKELLYFTKPTAAPVKESDVTDGAKGYIISTGTDRSSNPSGPGDIVDVSRVVADRNGWFLVDRQGWYFTGHLMNRGLKPSDDYRLAFITPDLAALVSGGRPNIDGTAITGNVQYWSDQVERPHNLGGLWPMTVPAAQWARDLFPTAKDSEAIVAAKLANAKERWMQEYKKMEILREGARRGWLPMLERVRAKGHDFPRPTFHLKVGGHVLVRTVAPTKAAMTKVGVKLANRGSRISAEQLQGNPAYISYPVNELLPVNLTDAELASLTPSHILAHIRERMGDYDVQYMPESQSTILAGFR